MAAETAPKVIGLPDRITVAGVRDDQNRALKGLFGRDEAIDALDRLLVETSGDVAIAGGKDALAMHAAGGIGKTAVAVEYCYRYLEAETIDQRGVTLIWWVNADSEATITSSCEWLAKSVGVELDQRFNIRDQVTEILATRTGKWLAVYDNVANQKFFEKWGPRAGNGQTLVTTRSDEQWPSKFSLGLLTADASKAWLVEAATRTGEDHKPLPVAEADKQAALTLTELLDGHALAISMAAAVIAESGQTIQQYLDRFAKNPHRFLDSEKSGIRGYEGTVHTAIDVSLNRLRSDGHRAAVKMLEYASFYHPDNIPLRIFTSESLDGADPLDEAVALKRLSLIQHHKGKEQFSVHRLTQEVTRYFLKNPPSELVQTNADGDTLGVNTLLVCTANSLNMPLRLEDELRELQQTLSSVKYRAQLKVEHAPATQTEDIARKVRDLKPSIVHFSGHGGKTGTLNFSDGSGSSEPVTAENLRSFFAGRRVRLVVLNACYSLAVGEAIAHEVDAVIATPSELVDDAALQFSRVFYGSLGNGHTVGEAFRDASDAIRLNNRIDEYHIVGDENLRLVDAL